MRLFEVHSIKKDADDNYWVNIKEFDEIITEKELLMVPKLPVPVLQTINDDLLFRLNLPRMQETKDEKLPIFLAPPKNLCERYILGNSHNQ